MGAYVFGNEVLDSWLHKKSEEILSKVDKERITTEEMLILVLKAQTNHFHHVDVENREEFSRINGEFKKIHSQFKEFNESISKRFEQVDKRFERVDKRFEQVDKRFERVDKRFDNIIKILMWGGALIVTMISGLYVKLLV